MMKRLLIGYDGSPCADAAIDDLARVGLPGEIEAHVMTVADVWLPSESSAPDPTFPAELSAAARHARQHAVQALESARQTAARAADRLRSGHPQWKVTAEAVADSPGWALVRKAEQWRADLVVLGSHGRSTLEKIFLGSVSQKVAAEARSSVHITRPRRHSKPVPLRVVIAVDGSPESMATVDAAVGRSWPAGAEFHIVTVLDPRMESAIGTLGDFARRWTHTRDEDARQSMNRILEAAAQKLFDAKLSVETFLLRGDVKHELLAHADGWETDLIFIGARGQHQGQQLSLGTTASAVAGRAHCSVEIVRAG